MGHLNVVWRFVAGLTRMQTIGWKGFREKVKKKGRVYERWGDTARRLVTILMRILVIVWEWLGGGKAKEEGTVHEGWENVDRGYEVGGGVVRV